VLLTEPLALLAVAAGLSLLAAAAVWTLAVRLRRSETERRRATAELNRRLSELFALQELSYVLAESLESERIVEQVVRYAIRFGETSGALVALAGDGPGMPWRVVAAEGTLADLAGRAVPEDDPGIIARSAGREQMELVERPSGNGAVLLGDVAVSAAAAVPLRAHGIVVGTLVGVDPPGGEFTPDGVRLLSTIATHAAVVIANARFFEMVRRGKEQWETAFDALREGLAVVDADGRVVRANRSLATLLGGPLPRLIGEPLATPLLGGEHGLADLLAHVRRGEHPPALVTRSAPLARTLRITAAPILSGTPQRHVVVLVEDVTERQALESQLIQSEKLAAVGQLVSGVAHELNNPLTSITGLAEFLVEQKELGPGDRTHLRVIHEQAERAGRIVRNLLTFARQGPADRALVDVSDVCQRTVLLISHDLRVRDIEVHRALDPALPTVLGDRHELQQVVLNLLTNAAQAVGSAPPGRPRTITVTTWADEQVHLRVADSGPGIPDAIMPRLFTPFFTTKEPGHGTGLGLSICFSIVTAHGGRIEAERPAMGAAIRIDLPRAPAGAAARTPDTLPSLPAEAPGHRAILLVDDDPAVRITVETLFGREGHTVEVARAAPQVLDVLRDRPFDLVIVDARAAAPGGERLLVEELVERLPEVRARILVANGDVRASTEHALRQLGVPYVRKPFNLRDLRSAAARVWAAGAVS
jgi:two-component system NtrC family sensor kinase